MHSIDSQSTQAERVLEAAIRPVAVVMVAVGAIVVVLLGYAAATEGDGARMLVSLVLGGIVGVVAVGGGVWRLMRSPRRWGLGSAALMGLAGLCLTAASGALSAPLAMVLIVVGVVVAFATALLILAAVAARRDRRDLPSRL